MTNIAFANNIEPLWATTIDYKLPQLHVSFIFRYRSQFLITDTLPSSTVF